MPSSDKNKKQHNDIYTQILKRSSKKGKQFFTMGYKQKNLSYYHKINNEQKNGMNDKGYNK